MYKKPPAAPQTRLIGNEQVGILEVPILGGLTIEEDETIDEMINSADSVVVLASQAAQRIVLEENRTRAEGEPELTSLEAYRIIEDAIFHRTMEPKAHSISIRHAEAIVAVRTAHKELESFRSKALVTALLRHRLGVHDIPPKFPRLLYYGLVALGEEEKTSEEFPSVPMTAEALGKPPKAKRAARKRTGTPDSGS
jgi:hypothetical protein